MTNPEQFDAAFLSPSGVKSFYAANKLKDETVYCCIGTTPASALREKFSIEKIVSPLEPSSESMLDAIVRYSKTNKTI